MGNHAGKVVLITGASAGIGAELAREFARKGARLVLAARRTERLNALCEEIAKSGGEAIAVTCDVTRDGDVERAVAAAIAKFGKLDGAVANAGFGVVGRVESLKIDDYRRQFETNIYGVLRTVHGSLPELKRSRGFLAIIGSVAGHVALPNTSPYSMSKFAVRALADALTEELRPEGVAVTLISPGFVDSEIRKVDNLGALHPETRDPMPGWIRMPADQAARQIVRAIGKRRREAIITFHGKLAVFVKRHFPWIIVLLARFGLRGRAEPSKH